VADPSSVLPVTPAGCVTSQVQVAGLPALVLVRLMVPVSVGVPVKETGVVPVAGGKEPGVKLATTVCSPAKIVRVVWSFDTPSSTCSVTW